VVGWAGTIRRTTDGGANWVSQTSGTPDNLYGVSFTDVNSGTAVGLNGTIRRTTDGGTNWVGQTSGTPNTLRSISFIDENVGFVVGPTSGLNGVVLRTTDAGATWVGQPSGTITEFRGVSFTDANHGTAVGFNSTIIRTTTGGTGSEPPQAPTLVSPGNDSTVLAPPLLVWNSLLGALSYSVSVSTTPYFTTRIVNQSNITDTSYQLSALPDTMYYWRVSMTDATGISGWSETRTFNNVPVVSVSDDEGTPQAFGLSQNFPNPFNPSTVIRYNLPAKAFVSLEVFSVLGERVLVLVNEEKEAGQHNVHFDGRGLSSGMYMYRMIADQFVETRKLVLVK